jgi:hypothetical protein
MGIRAPRLWWSLLAGAVATAATVAWLGLRKNPDEAPEGKSAPTEVARTRAQAGRGIGPRAADAAGPVAADPFASEEAMRAHGYTPAREVKPPPEPRLLDLPPVREPPE